MSGCFMGAAGANGVSPMTLSSNFDSPSGASPQTTAARTVTVPSGNPGIFLITFSAAGTGNFSYSINGGAFTNLTSGDALAAITTGQTLQFKVLGGATTITNAQLKDVTVGTNVGTSFGITTS